jgi:hypothetical protein
MTWYSTLLYINIYVVVVAAAAAAAASAYFLLLIILFVVVLFDIFLLPAFFFFLQNHFINKQRRNETLETFLPETVQNLLQINVVLNIFTFMSLKNVNQVFKHSCT